MQKSHKIWNKRNPGDKVKKGEVIHHRNENHNDDREKNQQKMLFGKHISLHKTGNKYGFGNKSRTEMKNTEEMKRKMGLANKGMKRTEETKKKMRGNKNALGLKHTEETKRKISLAKRGNKYALGLKHTEETKRKIGLKSRGRKHTEETKMKMRKGQLNRRKKEREGCLI